MANRRKIIYSLSIKDIQDVAKTEIDRELTSDEVDTIVDNIGDRINWYEIILNAIMEKIDINK